MDIKMFVGVVNGTWGSNCLTQATSNLSGSWTTLMNVAQAARPCIFIDYNPPLHSRRLRPAAEIASPKFRNAENTGFPLASPA
jgi:hypothetical protein